MFALLPLAMVIAVVLNAPGLWEAFSDPKVDLFPVLLRLLVVALMVDVVLYVANRLMAVTLAHPPVDVVSEPEPEIVVGSATTVVTPDPVTPPPSATINIATVAEIDPLPLTSEAFDPAAAPASAERLTP